VTLRVRQRLTRPVRQATQHRWVAAPAAWAWRYLAPPQGHDAARNQQCNPVEDTAPRGEGPPQHTNARCAAPPVVYPCAPAGSYGRPALTRNQSTHRDCRRESANGETEYLRTATRPRRDSLSLVRPCRCEKDSVDCTAPTTTVILVASSFTRGPRCDRRESSVLRRMSSCKGSCLRETPALQSPEGD